MPTFHDELVKATTELVKQTHVRNKKQIQCLEREIHLKNLLNLILQQFLIKFIWSAKHFVDVPNYKFDEVIQIILDILNTVKVQTPTVDANDKLSKMVNLSFQKVFDKINEIKGTMLLAPMVGPSDARGGEVFVTSCKRSSDFQLRYETTDQEEGEEMYVDEKVFLAIQFLNEPPSFRKTISGEEKKELVFLAIKFG